MAGLVEEGEEVMSEGKEKDDAPADLALIGAAQRVEHYEIAAYTTARNLALQLRQPLIVQLLTMSLGEEQNAGQLLDQVAQPLCRSPGCRRVSSKSGLYPCCQMLRRPRSRWPRSMRSPPPYCSWDAICSRPWNSTRITSLPCEVIDRERPMSLRTCCGLSRFLHGRRLGSNSPGRRVADRFATNRRSLDLSRDQGPNAASGSHRAD